jgi:hypothetical protein
VLNLLLLRLPKMLLLDQRPLPLLHLLLHQLLPLLLPRPLRLHQLPLLLPRPLLLPLPLPLLLMRLLLLPLLQLQRHLLPPLLLLMLRQKYNGTKIILISAYDLDGELVKDLEDKYIAKCVEKPIHLTNLIELVADIIC